MLSDNITAPCRGCTDRWVNENGTCHSTCERYADFKAYVAVKSEAMKLEQSRAVDPRSRNFSASKQNYMLKRRKK